ncbi:MAG TPA: OadG family protein [Bacillota bacterium]|nr:OadG family protein [Bacillota bacterium]
MDINEFYLGIRVTLIGMGVVFAALYVLQLVMYGMKALFYKEPIKTHAPAVAVAEPVVETIEPEHTGLPASLIAAISVAVAAYMGGRPGNVVSIRKLGDGKSPWQHAARIAPFEKRRS